MGSQWKSYRCANKNAGIWYIFLPLVAILSEGMTNQHLRVINQGFLTWLINLRVRFRMMGKYLLYLLLYRQGQVCWVSIFTQTAVCLCNFYAYKRRCSHLRLCPSRGHVLKFMRWWQRGGKGRKCPGWLAMKVFSGGTSNVWRKTSENKNCQIEFVILGFTCRNWLTL